MAQEKSLDLNPPRRVDSYHELPGPKTLPLVGFCLQLKKKGPELLTGL